MGLEEQLKSIILEKYKSVSAFSHATNIANSTLDSILKRGIINSGVTNVIKIFRALDLDMDSISTGTLSPAKSNVSHVSDVFSKEEIAIIMAYRSADKDTRTIVDTALKRFMQNDGEKFEIATG